MACDCGHAAHYAGRRERTVTTALGPVTLERACYHCEACGTGFAPRDCVLGFDNGSLPPAVLRMVGIAGSEVSFAMGSRLIDELAGLRIDPKTVERHAEALGREVAEDERGVIEPEPGDAPTLYVGLDGTGVPVRKTETEGRQGKQADGSTKTREVKLMVSGASCRVGGGAPCRRPEGVAVAGSFRSTLQEAHNCISCLAAQAPGGAAARHFGSRLERRTRPVHATPAVTRPRQGEAARKAAEADGQAAARTVSDARDGRLFDQRPGRAVFSLPADRLSHTQPAPVS